MGDYFMPRNSYSLSQDAFFLQGTNSLSRQCHSYFLTINDKGFLLKVWLEDSLRTAQRKTHVVTVELAFASDFAS